jgi:hypothetical protein
VLGTGEGSPKSGPSTIAILISALTTESTVLEAENRAFTININGYKCNNTNYIIMVR